MPGALGPGLASRFFKELSASKAASSGLLRDLEDTAILVEGVREDRISDVTTNLIRRQLVEYTQSTAAYYAIPLQENVAVRPFWDAVTSSWKQAVFDLPVTDAGPLILVPKAIVRRSLFFDPGKYYRHYVLNFFVERELEDPKSPLVYLLKSGQRRVRKKDVEAKVRKRNTGTAGPGIEKRVNVDGSQVNSDLLAKFKSDELHTPPVAPTHEAIAEATNSTPPDLNALLHSVLSVPLGTSGAHEYERAVEKLLSALLYPSLVFPIREEKIHGGRKRIDITFTNMGSHDNFFSWLGRHYPAATIAVECKNYTAQLGNPEYDQLAGRFSPSRGKYGLLVSRSIDDKVKTNAQCRDIAIDDRGFVTALDDGDLEALVAEASGSGCTELGGLLHTRFKSLTHD